MFKITFVRLPFYRLFNASGYKLNTYPLNLCYLSSAVEKAGFASELVDGELMDEPERAILKNTEMLMNENVQLFEQIMKDPSHPVWEELFRRIKDTHPDAIGISCYTSSMPAVKILTRKLKESLSAPVILGGTHPTALPEHSLQYSSADFVVIGEGEETIVELLQTLASDKNVERTKGIGYRANGKIRINSRRTLIPEIDTLPLPKRKIPLKERYFGEVLSTSRGCPFNCIFCASNVMWGRKVRFRSIEDIIKELLTLKSLFHASFVRIVDDIFTINKKRTLEICKEIERCQLNSINYSIGSRVDTLDEDIVRAFKKVNIRTVTLGIESASPRLLKFMNKKQDLFAAGKTIRLLKKYGIKSHAFFMIGFPTEKKEDIKLTKEFIAEFDPDYAEVNMVSPYAGTKLWNMVFKDKNINDIDDWHRWFHQGLSTHRVDFDLDKEYKEFVEFTKKGMMPDEG